MLSTLNIYTCSSKTFETNTDNVAYIKYNSRDKTVPTQQMCNLHLSLNLLLLINKTVTMELEDVAKIWHWIRYS